MPLDGGSSDSRVITPPLLLRRCVSGASGPAPQPTPTHQPPLHPLIARRRWSDMARRLPLLPPFAATLSLLLAQCLPACAMLFHPNETLWAARQGYTATLWDNQMIRAADGSLHLFYLAGLWSGHDGWGHAVSTRDGVHFTVRGQIFRTRLRRRLRPDRLQLDGLWDGERGSGGLTAQAHHQLQPVFAGDWPDNILCRQPRPLRLDAAPGRAELFDGAAEPLRDRERRPLGRHVLRASEI